MMAEELPRKLLAGECACISALDIERGRGIVEACLGVGFRQLQQHGPGRDEAD